jgi:hypothetical protein
VAKERARNSAQAKARFIDNQSNIANWLLFGALAVFLAAAVVWSWDNRFRLKSTEPKAAEWRFFRHYSAEEASIAQGYFVTPRAARSIYYDPKNIKKTNGGAEILVLEDLETPDTLHATTPHLSIKALTEYKCGDMHERTHIYRQYSQNMAHGQVVFQDRFDSNLVCDTGKAR